MERPGPPPPAPPQPRAPVHLHSGMQAPRKIVDVQPAYPPIAIAARKEGVVILEATLDARGNVESVRVLRPDPLLEQAAIDAVRQWKYTPALLNGVAVPVIMTVTVNFTLR
jgi:protein TonB